MRRVSQTVDNNQLCELVECIQGELTMKSTIVLIIGMLCCDMVSLFHFDTPTAVVAYRANAHKVWASFSYGFDQDFADTISKPLPQWYVDALVERERLLKELEQNRDRILAEFRAKYEVSKAEREVERLQRLEAVKKRLVKKKRIERRNWFTELFSKGHGNQEGIECTDRVDETAEEIMSTKEKWDAFWKEEEAQTGFYFPSLLEVFPELEFKWPTWSKRRDGTAVECDVDEDCPFPQACCPHPIIPGVKFCCTGWGQRVMIPNYAFQPLMADPSSDSDTDQEGGERQGDRLYR